MWARSYGRFEKSVLQVYNRIISKKSKEMIISFSQDVNFKKCVPNIAIEGIPVEVVKHAKLLGVILSDDLTWNMHVDSIVKKAAKRVYISIS